MAAGAAGETSSINLRDRFAIMTGKGKPRLRRVNQFYWVARVSADCDGFGDVAIPFPVGHGRGVQKAPASEQIVLARHA
jgi:hypothetical protein